MLSHFSCISIDKIGNYLQGNTTISCGDSRYNQYLYFLVIPCMVIWIIGLPAIVLLIITKRRRYLYRYDNKIVFGFLYNGYKFSKFYWEFVIMFRKVIMITISVFFYQWSITV